ncbi:MAG: MarR family transcriptional regulator [Leptospiraceae bacterium]|nr:MarR family transcriptional regulator [Leptospiraceae bacterium]MDW7977096.1 MarR family transcriptional regulator [Leptospiraceae bacterium]
MATKISEQNLILNMGTVFRSSIDIIKSEMQLSEKISTLALSILIQIDENPEISQGELGKLLKRDPMTMSQAVRALQLNGLVVSEQDKEDKRIKRLKITKKGKQVADNLRNSEKKLIDALIKKWGKQKVLDLAKAIWEFNEFLREYK